MFNKAGCAERMGWDSDARGQSALLQKLQRLQRFVFLMAIIGNRWADGRTDGRTNSQTDERTKSGSKSSVACDKNG